MQSRSERIAKNTGFLFVRLLVMVIIGLFTSRVVLQTLGIDDYGLNNLVGGLVTMFSFLQSALTNATSRYIAFDLGGGDKDKLSRTFSMTLNAELILAAIIVVLAELLGPWLIEVKLNIPAGRVGAAHFVYQLSIINFAVGLIMTPFSSLIVAHERMNIYAWMSIVNVVLKLLIVYLLWIIPFDKLYVLATLSTVTTLLVDAWYVWYCRKYFPDTKYIKYWDKKLIKELMSYSGLSLIVNMTDALVSQCISIFFNLFSGVAANAAWGIALQVNYQLQGFLGSFSSSYSPQIIKSYAAKDFSYFYKLIFSASKLSHFLYFGFAFPIIINIHLILKVWLGTPPKMSDLFLLLIIIFTIFDAFQYPLMNAVHATGNLKVHQPMVAGIKILNIPISYGLLKLGFPIYTVLIVYASLNAVCAVCRTIYLHYLIHLDLHAYLKDVVIKITVTSLAAIAFPIYLYFTIKNGWVLLATTTVSFFAVYIPMIYFYALNASEQSVTKNMVMKGLAKLHIIRYNG